METAQFMRRASIRYEVGETLARGGMGTIHRAHDRVLQRAVAYKRMRVDHEAQRAAMTALFRREFETMLSLEHPNTVHALDFGWDEEGPFYTMELLAGADLTQAAPLDWRAGCAVLRDVASALALLHARRLVHRDLSPNNVRLLADGSAKLLDFGALVSFGAQRDIVGTPAFMSPECARGSPLDARADLFSLGALAYWTLTRRVCYPAQSIDGLEDAWRVPVRAPSTWVAELPVELDQLILSLLELERDARPHAAAHVIERLSAIADLPAERDQGSIARSYLARPPLMEREPALEQLRNRLQRARAGQGGVLLLEATAGLGRSALLEQLTTDAQLDGMLVMRAAGSLHGAPFALLRELLQGADAARREPAEGAVLAASGAELIEQRARTAERLQNELLAYAEHGALLVSIDDAQLADVDSLRALAALSDALLPLPVLLLLSIDCSVPLEPEVRAKLDRSAELVTLAPLTRAGIAQLAASVLGDVPNARRATNDLYEASGGSPATTVDLLRALWNQGQISYAGGTFTVPRELDFSRVSRARLRLVRLADLDASAHELASVLGSSSEPLSQAQLQSASGLSEYDVLSALGALTRRGVVSENLDGYRLGNPLLRAEIDELLSVEARAATHAAIARALLEANPTDPRTRIAAGAHLIRGGDELRGAEIIDATCHQARFEVAALSSLGPSLETALAVYERHGRSDAQAIRLLVPLALSGFFGDLDAQTRYQERTLRALSRSTGLAFVPRLSRSLGPKLALYVGLFFGLVSGMFVRARAKRTFRDDLQALFGVVASAVAAHVSAFDPRAATGVVAWLDPFAVAHPRSGPAVARQFSLASIDVARGRLTDAEERYRAIEGALAQGVRGLDAPVRRLIEQGVLNGRAQLAVTYDDPRALTYAQALQSSSAFFAPHAESVYVAYHGLRGDEAMAERHRSRAEDLALRGGLSWSAHGLLCFWLLQNYAASENALGLVHVIAALEPIRNKSPGLAALHGLALAGLSRLRGQYEAALERYREILDSEVGRLSPYYGTERAYQAECLQRLDRHAEAKQLCLDTLTELADPDPRSPHRRLLEQQLALATARAGDCTTAFEMLRAQLRHVADNNELVLGSLHHDLARVAIIDGSLDAFLSHANAAEQHYRATRNPALLARHERLLARARRASLLGEAAAATQDDLDVGDTETGDDPIASTVSNRRAAS